MLDRRELLIAAAALGSAPGLARADPQDLAGIAARAWLFALPLIEMAQARSRMTAASGGQGAGVNRFRHARSLVGPADRGVTTPNNDTLYSSAFVDLTGGPVRLDIPAAGRRYLSVAVMDMYTNNNIVLGARTPGGASGAWRLIGPDAKAGGPRDLRVETPHAWVLARTLVDGPADLPAAHAVQDGLLLSGSPAAPPEPSAGRSAPAAAYFDAAAKLAAADPPRRGSGLADFQAIRALRTQGPLSPAAEAALEQGAARARSLVEGASGKLGFEAGWSWPRMDLGDYGDDFIYRAAVAVAGLGALPVEQAMYLRAQAPGGDWRFLGDGDFRLTMPAAVPADAFWSLTMYEATPEGQFFLTENPIDRYAVGDRTPGLRRNPDGDLDILISRKPPEGEQRANWLPAPRAGPFAMTLRVYLPRPELIRRAWRPPAVSAA